VEAIEGLYPDRLAEHFERLGHHAFRGEVALRGAAYTDLNATNAGDSGTGLDIDGVSNPPGGC
jgi:hypothetical protein